MRSQRSRNSGAGGLWDVRMALTPIARSEASRRSQTRSGTAAPTAAGVVVQVDAEQLDAAPIQQETAVLVERDGADPERRGDNVERAGTVRSTSVRSE